MSRPTRPERRVPSGGRPRPSRQGTASSVNPEKPNEYTSRPFAGGDSTASLDRLLNELEHEITASPQASPSLDSTAVFDQSRVAEASDGNARSATAPSEQYSGHPAAVSSSAGPSSPKKSRAQTLFSNPISPRKPKPKMSLVTNNLNIPAENSKKSPVSPGAKHWTHVRAQVLGDHAQTPVAPPVSVKKQGLVSKAAGRLGFRQAAENMLGYGPELSDLMKKAPAPRTASQEEEARERRKFSRDVKACLESCGKQETRRRLNGMKTGGKVVPPPSSKRQSSLPLRSGTGGPAYNSAQELPPFAPLLTTLHGYVSAARAKRPWAVTLPWHSEVLNELGTAFLDGCTDNGGHLMAVEIFGIVVRTWAPARSEVCEEDRFDWLLTLQEELDRWLWICNALRVNTRPLRVRQACSSI